MLEHDDLPWFLHVSAKILFISCGRMRSPRAGIAKVAYADAARCQ